MKAVSNRRPFGVVVAGILAAISILMPAAGHSIDIADYVDEAKLERQFEPASAQEKKQLAPWKTAYFKDENGDGRFTITEVGSWLADTFFFPGYLLTWFLWGTGLGVFLEITPLSFHGVGSGIFSGITWLLVLLYLGSRPD